MHEQTPPPPAPGATAISAGTGPAAKPKWRRKQVLIPVAIAGLILGNALFANSAPGTGSAPDDNNEASQVDTEVLGTVEQPADATSTTASPATTSPSVTESSSDGVRSLRALLDSAEAVDRHIAPVHYERDDYTGGGWDDSDGDCQSDRHEVLIEESLVPVQLIETGCRVETGQWLDAFTGETLTSADEATIDHLVPLSAAHRAGGWAWDLSLIHISEPTRPY